jgi:hypothetical protein
VTTFQYSSILLSTYDDPDENLKGNYARAYTKEKAWTFHGIAIPVTL